MVQNLKKRMEGFTIIEVMIVLAIAGLIMLIVFLAIPALQRSQRNNARNADASRVAAAVNECLSNRNGDTTQCASMAQIGLTNTSLSQFTGAGAVTFGTPAYSTTSAAVTFGTANGGCNPAGTAAGAGGSAKAFSVTYGLEPTTPGIPRCIGG